MNLLKSEHFSVLGQSLLESLGDLRYFSTLGLLDLDGELDASLGLLLLAFRRLCVHVIHDVG